MQGITQLAHRQTHYCSKIEAAIVLLHYCVFRAGRTAVAQAVNRQLGCRSTDI
jgi:hypothetical protein